MADIHVYKVIIEYKKSLTPEQVSGIISTHMSTMVDRFIGLSFNVFGECDFGKTVSARLVFENTKKINADKLGAILNFKSQELRVSEVLHAE